MPQKYGTAAGLIAYFLARGKVVDPDLDTTEIDAGLLVASEWIDANFRGLFPGLKTGMRVQEREWPRTGAYDYYGYAIGNDAIPVEIENATYEMALIELTTPGSLSVNFTPGEYKAVSIDGVLSVDYAQFSQSSEVQTQFRKVIEILSRLLSGNSQTSSLSGVVARA